MGYVPPDQQKCRAERLLLLNGSVRQPVTPSRICSAVCERQDVAWTELFSKNRGNAKVSDARALAMYVLRKGLGWPLERVGDYFHRHNTTVDRGLEKVMNEGPLRREARALMEILKHQPAYHKPAPGTKTQALVEAHV